MNWDRSRAIGLAKPSCTTCHGSGLRPVRKGMALPCNCVFRAIFRACYQRFKECAESGANPGSVNWEFCGGQTGYRVYSRKREEFVADFCLIAQRSLDDASYQLFRYHYLLGADWRLCCGRLGLERGAFFHQIYRIEGRLGRIFAELRPYALYPVDEYFSGITRKAPPRALEIARETEVEPEELLLSA